jgi:5-methylcytosine-specific restriction endonuclease McrA
MHANPALVLNADFRPLSYFPLSLISWQDAVQAVFAGKVAVVSEYDAYARSPSRKIRLPSVIALRHYQPLPKRVAFTRFNVFLRDRFRCQYCGDQFEAADLTFDHVVPRCKGGQTAWDNVCAACRPCNSRKDKFITMKPKVMPRMPAPRELLAAKRAFPLNYLHESWRDYLYWDVELDT